MQQRERCLPTDINIATSDLGVNVAREGVGVAVIARPVRGERTVSGRRGLGGTISKKHLSAARGSMLCRD